MAHKESLFSTLGPLEAVLLQFRDIMKMVPERTS